MPGTSPTLPQPAPSLPEAGKLVPYMEGGRGGSGLVWRGGLGGLPATSVLLCAGGNCDTLFRSQLFRAEQGPGVSGDFWGSQEGCQGPFRRSGQNRDFP